MDHIKLLVKDVLHKIQDIPDIPLASMRMSEISSNTSLSTSNHNSINNGTLQKEDMSPRFTEIIPRSESISNNFKTTDKGSKDSVCSAPVLPQILKSSPPKIIMGKRALMRSRSADMKSDQAVVHELVHEKYHDKISHCIGRMYQRRLSRESKGTDDDGTSSNYSTHSLKTPESLYDGKSYFSLLFPQDSAHSIQELNDTNLFNSTVNSKTESEYDAGEFLKNALSDMSFGTETRENIKLQHSQSFDPVNGSTFLSKAGSLYTSVRRSLRRACSFKDKETSFEATKKNKIKNRDRCQSFTPDRLESTENLMRELYIQNGIIFQVSKALAFCRSSKDIASPQYVEAEKILLVASCQKEAIQTALDAAEFDENPKDRRYSGTLEISKLTFYLKADSALEQEPVKNFDEYFVIVVTSGRNVLASKVLTLSKNGELAAIRNFELNALQTDFAVSVAVYSMKIRHLENGDAKQQKKDRKCPSTKSLFHLNHHKSSRRNLLVDNVSSIKPSSFALCGSCTLRCADLQKTQFRMHNVSLSSSLEAYFTASLSGDVKLCNRTQGFLTIGFEDKCHLTWNRRWCVLDGRMLKYWNYPSEEFTCIPIGVIDLARATEKASPADRSMCARPKSLCLLIRTRDDLVLKYFLTADSLEDKQSWLENVNFVIGTLEAWNLLGSNELVSSL